MTLKEYIDKYSPFGFFSDEELIIGFLKSRPDILANTISTLCMLNYKAVLSLEHKVRVKDDYLNCLKDWAQVAKDRLNNIDATGQISLLTF